MMRNQHNLIMNIERAIVHFVRLMAITLILIIGVSCSKITTNGIVSECKANIETHLSYASDIKSTLVEKYIASESGQTFYYYLFKVECKVNNQERIYFATVRCSIRNDLSLSLNDISIVQGSD